MATLRKSLRQKEEELSLANRNLASALSRASQLSERDERIAALSSELSTTLISLSALQATLRTTETDLRDRNSQLETTRADLVATIEDKATKIDELEEKVLELRKSREELAIEDEGRLQEVQKQLDMAVKDKQEIEQRVKLLEDEAAARKKAEEGEKDARREVESIKSQLEVLQKEHASIYSSAQNASTRFAEYETSISTLTAQINDLLSAKLSRETALEELRNEHAETKKQRDRAAEDLENFQKEAMANETKVLGELREEIGNLRRLREDEKAVWDRSKAEMEASIETLKQGEAKSKARLVEALKTLEDAAQANRSLEKKLSYEAEGRRTAQEERDQAFEKLKEAAGVANAQLEHEITTRHELETQLAFLKEQLDSQRAAVEALTRNLDTERQSAKELARQLDITQKEMETQESRIEKAVDERKDVERRLSEMESALEAGEKEWKGVEKRHSSFKALENDLRKQLEAQVTSRENVESKLQEITLFWESENAQLRQQLQSAVSRRQEVEEDLTALQHQHDTITTSEAGLRKILEVESTARRVAEKKIIQLGRQREASSSEAASLQKKRGDEQMAREELERRLQDTEGRLQSEMEELRVKDEAEFKNKQEAERKFTELIEKQCISETANQDMQKRVEAEIVAQQIANDNVSALKEKLEAASSTEQRLHQRLSEESVSQAQLREQLEVAALTEQRLRQLLEAESASRQAAEKELSEVFASSKTDSEKQKDLGAELAEHRTANQKLTSLEAAHTELQAQFKAHKTASEAAQKDAKAEYSKEVNTLRKELLVLRESLSTAKAEASDAKTEADAHREKVTKLAKDVVELEARHKENKTLSSSTSVSARLRTLSTPGPWVNSGEMGDASIKGMKARELKGTTAGFGAGERESSMARLHVGHKDEIERLEKVVEVQKGIIDEQRMKIERWSKVSASPWCDMSVLNRAL